MKLTSLIRPEVAWAHGASTRFDPAPYAHLYAHEWAVDLRHAQVLFAVCAWARPRVVVEIGSHRGASTAAFVEAIRAGFVEQLHCIEPRPRPQLFQVCARAAGRVTIHRRPLGPELVRFVLRPAAMVLIDGDHGAPALTDLAAFLRENTAIIALHDTNPLSPHAAACWGAIRAAEQLRSHDHGAYAIAHDQALRPGERTHRGLTLGFLRDPALADRTQALMLHSAPWWPPDMISDCQFPIADLGAAPLPGRTRRGRQSKILNRQSAIPL
jgi:hypothetical protein